MANANVKEQTLAVDYSKFDSEITKQSADEFFQKALDSESLSEKEEFLKQAGAKYYILSNIDRRDIYPCIRLARIYDMQGNDRYAKAFFYRALGLNYKDIDANFYFAEYFYKRNEYKDALNYYHKASNFGREDDAQTLKKIGKIYERFGDYSRAKLYYNKSLELNPQDEEISRKIKELEDTDYKDTGYYKRRLRS